MILAATALGIFVGSIPTADGIARLRGHDLREQGTGNPGARNALAVGGPVLGVSILVVELIKGAAAVTAGRLLAGDGGGALAAVGAVAGNVYNPWVGFRGGKGLAITGGTLVAAWPPMALLLGVLLAAGTRFLGRSGPTALTAFGIWLGVAAIGVATPVPAGWGLDSAGWLLAGAIGSVAVMAPKHVADALRSDDRRSSPG